MRTFVRLDVSLCKRLLNSLNISRFGFLAVCMRYLKKEIILATTTNNKAEKAVTKICEK